MDSQNLAPVPNTAPAQDYTSGSIPGSPDHPGWPDPFFTHYKAKADGLTIPDALMTEIEGL